MFNVSHVKVNELAEILECKPPVISRMFKDLSEPFIEKKIIESQVYHQSR